jgi:excisionase family DNA binding protein
MGIRQLPSGAFQVRFQHHHTAHAATYPTRALAQEAEPLLRAEAVAGRRDETDTDEVIASPAPRRTQDTPRGPTPHPVRVPSASAAELMDKILADVIEQGHVVPAPPHDEVLTTSQAAVLLGISRPTLVAWLEAGRIPFHWCGSHRRVTRSDVLAYLDRLP